MASTAVWNSGATIPANLIWGQFLPPFMGGDLHIIGDSRFAGGWANTQASAASISGSTLTVTCAAGSGNQGVGEYSVGQEITLGRAGALEYIRATLATVDGTSGATATITYPEGALYSGTLTGSKYLLLPLTSTMCGPISAAMKMSTPRFAKVVNHCYQGARLAQAINAQARCAVALNANLVVIWCAFNDYAASVDNQSAAYTIEKIRELWLTLQGRPIAHCLEPTLGSSYVTNITKVNTINAWMTANAARYGVRLIDLTGMLASHFYDGTHPNHQGCIAIAPSVITTLGWPTDGYTSSTYEQGTATNPAANPTFAGTLGASQTPTGYTKAVSGSVTVPTFSLNAKEDGSGNEWQLDLASTGSGSAYIKTENRTVTSRRYRVRGTIKMVAGVLIDYVEVTLRNTTGDTLLTSLVMPKNTSSANSGDGTYTIYVNDEVQIQSGVTSVYLRPRVFIEATGASGSVKFSDFDMFAVT